jgi:hypothetical protein
MVDVVPEHKWIPAFAGMTRLFLCALGERIFLPRKYTEEHGEKSQHVIVAKAAIHG